MRNVVQLVWGSLRLAPNMHPTFLFEYLYDQQDSDQYCSFHLKSGQMRVPQHCKNGVKERVNSCLQLVLDRMIELLVDKLNLPYVTIKITTSHKAMANFSVYSHA